MIHNDPFEMHCCNCGALLEDLDPYWMGKTGPYCENCTEHYLDEMQKIYRAPERPWGIKP